MKITFVLTWADAMGGTERAIYTQAEYLARTHDVEILSVFRTSRERFFDIDPRITVRYLVDNTGPVPRPVAASRLDDTQCRALAASASRLIEQRWESAFNRLSDIELEQALREIDTDVLVSTSPALMAAITTLAPPRVLTVHQEHRPSHLRGDTGEPLFLFTPRLDALIVLTERTRSWFADTLREYAPRTAVIVNALPAAYRPRSTRTSRLITIAGRVVRNKQVDHAVRAFASIAAAHPDWNLRVAGDGPQLNDVRRLAESLDVHDRVQFVGSTSRMTEEWAKSSIALLTSRDGEALPLVLLEAFAAGVPAISYDCQTGPAEIISHGVNGFLVTQDDVAGLSAAMERLIVDDALREEFGSAALAASADYRLDVVMAEWEALYSSLLASRADPVRIREKSDRVAAWIAHTGGSGFVPAAPRPERLLIQRSAREIERAIAEADPTLIRSAGRLSVVSDETMPSAAARINLDLAVDALEAGGIEFREVRSTGLRVRIAIHAEHRDPALEVLAAAFQDLPVYCEIFSTNGTMTGTVLGAMIDNGSHGVIGGLRLFQPVVTSSGTLRYSGAYGCDVEFWPDSLDGQSIVPLRRTLIGASVPKAVATTRTREVLGRSLPSLEPLHARLVDDVDFPIDVVYTWVDGDDPVWLARKNAALAAHGQPPTAAASGDARFRTRDELRYSLRSLDMFAPWVRDIFIVTDDQTPAWLDLTHPRIRVVSHKELFGGRGALPTFNSHAIESQLHRIDGLAEHFLYFNDDVFLGRPVDADAFFKSNGDSLYFPSPTSVPAGAPSPDDDFNFAAGKNNRRLIEAIFGRTLTHAFLHTPHALRRSVLVDLDEAFPEDVARTAASQFRGVDDIAIPSSLHHYYGYFTGRATRGSLRVTYVDLGDPSQHPKLTQILASRGFDVFCLNDTHHGTATPAEIGLITRAFLRSYYPVRSQFETR